MVGVQYQPTRAIDFAAIFLLLAAQTRYSLALFKRYANRTIQFAPLGETTRSLAAQHRRLEAANLATVYGEHITNV